MTSSARIRVVQWATGAIGRTTLRAVLDRPELRLVGQVRALTAQGRDAGDLARREPNGVLPTRDVEAILGLDADVVLPQAR